LCHDLTGRSHLMQTFEGQTVEYYTIEIRRYASHTSQSPDAYK
jgi:hypothetical protein